MEILQNLLSLLLNNADLGAIKPIIELIKNNSFDLKKTFSNLDLTALMPAIEQLMTTFKDKSPTATCTVAVGLDPIATIADKDIVYTLNKYFHELN